MKSPTSLLEALQSAQLPLAHGLLLGPNGCEWARWDGVAITCTGDPGLVANAYEGRFFTAELELRWRNDPATESADRAGHHVLLQTSADEELGENRYLLWGKLDAHGETLIQLPRGTMQAPLSGKPGQVITLITREIIDSDDYGNTWVCDERWVGFEVHDEKMSGATPEALRHGK